MSVHLTDSGTFINFINLTCVHLWFHVNIAAVKKKSIVKLNKTPEVVPQQCWFVGLSWSCSVCLHPFYPNELISEQVCRWTTLGLGSGCSAGPKGNHKKVGGLNFAAGGSRRSSWSYKRVVVVFFRLRQPRVREPSSVVKVKHRAPPWALKSGRFYPEHPCI